DDAVGQAAAQYPARAALVVRGRMWDVDLQSDLLHRRRLVGGHRACAGLERRECLHHLRKSVIRNGLVLVHCPRRLDRTDEVLDFADSALKLVIWEFDVTELDVPECGHSIALSLADK